MPMKIHAAARSRGLVVTLHRLGMRVSYDRLLQSSSDVRNGIYQRFLIENAVKPIKVAAKSLHYSSSRQHRPQPKLCNRHRFLP